MKVEDVKYYTDSKLKCLLSLYRLLPPVRLIYPIELYVESLMELTLRKYYRQSIKNKSKKINEV